MSTIFDHFKHVVKTIKNKFGVPDNTETKRKSIGNLVDTKSNTIENSVQLSFDETKLESFEITTENELSTSVELSNSRDIGSVENIRNLKIYYITDIHIMHKLKHHNAKSYDEILKVVEDIVDTIFNECEFMLLIGGDIASDYNIFEIFVQLLYKRNHDPSKLGSIRHILFVLGNHELWDFPEEKIEAIVTKYKQLIRKYGMYLIHNELYGTDDYLTINKASMDRILSASKSEIREKLRRAKIIIIGGIGFSGYNHQFNADNGIYRSTITREQEIEESDKFNNLYNKIVEALPDKKVIVFTHMPMSCWREKVEYHSGYIYVSGHTHKNFYYDDGEIRIYSDNQIGYGKNSPHTKWFEYDPRIDYFADYKDGIYKIKREEYLYFNHGKGIYPSFNSQFDILYMLKKNGYYCFIVSCNGKLSILNGGQKHRLYGHQIQYYFDNMDLVISKMNNPLKMYTEFQKSISIEIRRIGGYGKIHGCIIDIDFYYHIYVNPEDYKITGYWAEDMKNKIVYPNIGMLLKDANAEMYQKYNELSGNLPILYNDKGDGEITSPQFYYETDIYRASRVLCQMQRLGSDILTVWIDPKSSNSLIEFKS